ncbi:MAG TPA: histidine phosphatase family protein [Acidimicrobiales bacterium]|nr:histidine phosphatase family protein [Acidimicrobiales bacterium]
MSTPPRTELVLMRHGETDWNRSQLVQGHDDASRLTDEGREHVGAVAATLSEESFSLIVASDLGRAQESAAIAARILRLEIVTLALLRERNFGVLEGGPRSALTPQHTGVSNDVVIDVNARPPGGESLEDMAQRARRFFDLVHHSWPNTSLLVVTHGGMIRALMSAASGESLLGSTLAPVANCSLWRLSLEQSPQ